MLRSLRFLSVSSRTTISPSKGYSLRAPTDFAPKSVVVFSTPQNIKHVIMESVESMKQGVQVVVAGVDTVPGNQRNGVSELWMDEPLKIGHFKELDLAEQYPEQQVHTHNGEVCMSGHSHQHQHQHTHGGEPCSGSHSHGEEPAANSYNWSKPDGSITINIGTTHTTLALANTLFATQFANTMFFLEKGHPKQGQVLSELEITLPFQKSTTVVHDEWEPLFDGKKMEITSVAGNLLKQVDGQSCAGLLQGNDRLMSAGKESEVYVKIFPKDGSEPQRFKCIASGGAWGAKKDIVALNPEAQPQRGDKVSFYVLSPEKKAVPPTESKHFGVISFECSPEQQSFDPPKQPEQTLTHVFGAGSEQGFVTNGIIHESSGETVVIATEESP
ncbi:hypothetical protein DIURU_002266 [Diutina rugosa]|uniref:Uncharacterized protein n=1 Tax=Diutina rugosa TaxID=5481 RepID=A0A642UXH2_DIURU|nr:uncharacterized protein DIURU_002266 [Diutina rugosa]KAA8903754.1 hypothetical protein DIURU_002266 [Diutina rugosa]